MEKNHRITRIEEYEPLVGSETIGRKLARANKLEGFHGTNGFLVSSVQEFARRIGQLLKNRRLRDRMGRTARESVRQRFLMPRCLDDHLDSYASFESSLNHVCKLSLPAVHLTRPKNGRRI